jgi:UDP-N-acetylglucosamine 3-dehydrogenase
MIRTGVVGVGEMGQNHVRVYNEMEDTDLVGIADVNERRVREIANQHKTKAFTDYKDLLKEDLDAISIAVPTILHKKVAIDFIGGGVNCLIEKPIASNLEDAKEIIREAEKNNVKLAIGHIERFNPAVTKLKDN